MRLRAINVLCVLFWLTVLHAFRLRRPHVRATNAHTALRREIEESAVPLVMKAQMILVKPLIASLLSLSLLAPVHARSDFMSPEAEGGGGRFGRVASPESQAQVPEVQPKMGTNMATPSLKKGFQTKTGLKYFDIREGGGKSPRYGDLVTFQYFMYYKPPGRDAQLELIGKLETEKEAILREADDLKKEQDGLSSLSRKLETENAALLLAPSCFIE